MKTLKREKIYKVLFNTISSRSVNIEPRRPFGKYESLYEGALLIRESMIPDVRQWGGGIREMKLVGELVEYKEGWEEVITIPQPEDNNLQHLTKDEQKHFHQALRKSVEVQS